MLWLLVVYTSQEPVCVVESELVGLSEGKKIDDGPLVVVRDELKVLKLPEGH